jgi:exonuclease III
VQANVTCLRVHAEQVLAIQADILCLQEVRLTAAGQKIMEGLARQQGWDCHWGLPMESRGPGVWDAHHGGVAILLRRPWPARRVVPKEGDEVGQRLWGSGRWVHVHLCLGRGRTALNVQCVYGLPGKERQDLNDNLWADVMAYTARMGPV